MQKRHRWGQRSDHDLIDRRDLGEGMCKCPRCGYSMSRQAGMLCSSIPCPRCGTPMEDSNWR